MTGGRVLQDPAGGAGQAGTQLSREAQEAEQLPLAERPRSQAALSGLTQSLMAHSVTP